MEESSRDSVAVDRPRIGGASTTLRSSAVDGVTDQQALPMVSDDSGFVVREADLQFLGISLESLGAWREQVVPLGLTVARYKIFTAKLSAALSADGLNPAECDVRLKGSAASFFSGFHKTLPTTRIDLVEAFRKLRGRVPEPFEIEEIEERLTKEWLPSRTPPLRRPFDAMHKLGIDRVPSDYDLQISSDEIVARCEQRAEILGVNPIFEVTFNSMYDFVRKDLVEACMPNLFVFSRLMSDAFGRDVSVAVFRSDGPPNRSDHVAELSAHFREGDWRIDCDQP